jgi:hypothetical protein
MTTAGNPSCQQKKAMLQQQLLVLLQQLRLLLGLTCEDDDEVGALAVSAGSHAGNAHAQGLGVRQRCSSSSSGQAGDEAARTAVGDLSISNNHPSKCSLRAAVANHPNPLLSCRLLATAYCSKAVIQMNAWHVQ